MKSLFNEIPISDISFEGMEMTVVYAGIPHKIKCGALRGLEYFSDKYNHETFDIYVEDSSGRRLIILEKCERIKEWENDFRL